MFPKRVRISTLLESDRSNSSKISLTVWKSLSDSVKIELASELSKYYRKKKDSSNFYLWNKQVSPIFILMAVYFIYKGLEGINIIEA